jgi:hypothetical protein
MKSFFYPFLIIIAGAVIITSWMVLKNGTLFQEETKFVFPSPSIMQKPKINLVGSLRLEKSNPLAKISEPITITVYADSKRQPITGFDIVLSFNPQYMQYLNQKSLEENFDVFKTTNEGLLHITAIKKLNSNVLVSFEKTSLIEFTFQPIKLGTTDFTLIFSPGQKTDSNMINDKSEEILGKVQNLNVEIR